jgi:hypothetical protein
MFAFLNKPDFAHPNRTWIYIFLKQHFNNKSALKLKLVLIEDLQAGFKAM